MNISHSTEQKKTVLPLCFRVKKGTSGNLSRWCNIGYTLVEVMIAIALIMVLASIAIPSYLRYRVNAMNAAAIKEIRMIEQMIFLFEMQQGRLPTDLSEFKIASSDPWGNPYKYLNIIDADNKSKGKMRKDHFMVPVNSDFDLYSMGQDEKSQSPFTAKASRDDIVRVNNGRYVGLVSDF